MAEVNLCKLLKGHEGETFYSPIYGDVHIHSIEEDCIQFGPVKDSYIYLSLAPNGHHIRYPDKGECLIFPSKYQQDWNKWNEPKVWSDIRSCNVEVLGAIKALDGATEPIVKSVVALLKIQELIEQGYGGNITKEEWNDSNIIKYYINNELSIDYTNSTSIRHVAFHTPKQTREFLSYPENIQLIKEFYQYE